MKNSKLIKTVTVFVLICMISFKTPISIAHAVSHANHYKLNPFVSMGRTRTKVHWWYSQGGRHYYGYRIVLGADAWQNASGTDAGFVKVSAKRDAEIRIYSKNYGNIGWIGQHSPWFGYGNIKLNDYYHDSNGGYPTYAEVFSYEMGHAFGLLHYDCNNELMRPKGYIGKPNPQKGDIAGYRAKYGLR